MHVYRIQKFACIGTAAMALLTAMPLNADELIDHPKHIDQPHKYDEGKFAVAPKIAADLIAWIISKTGWTVSDAPPIHFITEAQLTEMYLGRPGGSKGTHVYAVYSDESHTIYLPEEWNPDSLFDRAALLHELVHHLQIRNGVKATCPAEYEQQAFHLQIAWVREQGVQDPYQFLNIDEWDIYYSSRCPEF